MAGTVRGGLRPHHPTKHSFILVGLTVVVIVLGINYWSTSAKNSRLLVEVAKLQKNYKLCAEQFGQLSGEKKRQENTANEKDRELEDTRRRLVDRESDVAKLQNMHHRYEDELDQCRNNVSTTLKQSRAQLETCEEKVEKVKVDQQEACNHQVQTSVDQLKHEHVLDKRKAVEEAVQLVRQRRQQREKERVESEQQKTVRRKQFAPQQLMDQWRQKLHGNVQQQKIEQQAEQSQQQPLEPVNQQQFPKQQQQQQLLEKELPQQQQNRQIQEQRQNAVEQQPDEPFQLPQQQLLQQPQKEFDEWQRDVQQQLPVQQKNSVLRGAEQQPSENRLPGMPLQQGAKDALQDAKDMLRQSLQKKPDQQRPQQIPQDVAQAKPKTGSEPLQMVNQLLERQPPNQEPQQPGQNDLQWPQQPDQRKPPEPLLFQVPAPIRARDYKHVGEQLESHDVQASRPQWKQQLVDINRQQQFEQLQQDKLHEHVQSQKESDHARPLMVPQQSEDQPSLLGNAREPPHLEGVIHMTGQIMASSIKDVAVRAPDGSMGQFDSLRNDHFGQPGIENMQVPVPANDNANSVDNGGQDSVRDDGQRDYAPLGQHEADINRRVNQKEMEHKQRDDAADMDEYQDYKDEDKNAQQPVEKRRDRR